MSEYSLQHWYCCKWGLTLKARLFASLYFGAGRRVSFWLFVVNFKFKFSIGQRFRAGRYKISHLQQYLPVVRQAANKLTSKTFPILGTFHYLRLKIRLRVIAKKILRDFWQKYEDCEQQLKSWYQEASKSEWRSPKDIKVDYPSASFLAGNRVVFNIKGNHYRLIVRINYDYQIMWIRFIGTHAQYDRIDATKI